MGAGLIGLLAGGVLGGVTVAALTDLVPDRPARTGLWLEPRGPGWGPPGRPGCAPDGDHVRCVVPRPTAAVPDVPREPEPPDGSVENGDPAPLRTG
ncbi:hypothetical protein FAF44_01810 [Nonomuraea sp. MG754425]|uniref:hypothetical protein n=1 Tax=Nonomuraea sp. MG754425 TaxID=2570319 RepID=UPI001F241201|nr:hypothetical protein [Nonomuraea sp. MG754425]MCF6467149.1 hypothetical protein [Nonomuraea sp. MG754425]